MGERTVRFKMPLTAGHTPLSRCLRRICLRASMRSQFPTVPLPLPRRPRFTCSAKEQASSRRRRYAPRFASPFGFLRDVALLLRPRNDTGSRGSETETLSPLVNALFPSQRDALFPLIESTRGCHGGRSVVSGALRGATRRSPRGNDDRSSSPPTPSSRTV